MAYIDKPRRSPRKISSLEAMREEMGHQIKDLRSFSHELKEAKDKRVDPSEIVFTGSGDSYASSLFAHYLTGGLATVADPYELQSNTALTRERTVFITSISGRTLANIQLASRIRPTAMRRIAVTAHPDSPLGKECDETIRLKYRSSGILTAGTVSFTSSLLALSSQIQPLPTLEGLDNIMFRAANWSSSVKRSANNSFVFVGSGIGYAIAAYGAFKIHEVLGSSADYQHSEQLGHSQLFSLGPRDTIVCIATQGDGKTVQICQELQKMGLRTRLFTSMNRDPVLFALEAAFALQHLVLKLAEARRLEECAFLLDPDRLSLSSRLIY